jgi:hypothetical protein
VKKEKFWSKKQIEGMKNTVKEMSLKANKDFIFMYFIHG